jgi:CHASE2 domain-containing sensor protein
MPAWLKIFMDTGEFLAFGLFFGLLGSLAHRNKTDETRVSTLRAWAYLQFGLFFLFTSLFFFMPGVPLLPTISGAVYLISSIAAIVLTLQMRKTVEMV